MVDQPRDSSILDKLRNLPTFDYLRTTLHNIANDEPVVRKVFEVQEAMHLRDDYVHIYLAVLLAAELHESRKWEVNRRMLHPHHVVIPVEHGFTCEKVPHIGSGYLHDASDDRPYDVDGVKYCGRCHVAL